MKVRILGWYNKKNCGDEAFELVLRQHWTGADLSFSHDSAEGDVVVLGGGDVLKKFYLDVIGERKFYVLGAGAGYPDELKDLANRGVVEAVFRNRVDDDTARGLGIQSLYCPDLAFGLKPELAKKEPSEKKKMAVLLTDAVNASHADKPPKELAYAEYFKWEMAESLAYISEWYDLVFIPMSDEPYDQDLRMILDVTSRMYKVPKTMTVLREKPSVMDLIRALSGMDLVVSMKFHGLVFGMMAGVPIINIGLTRKTHLFCEEACLGEYSLGAYGFQKERFLEVVKMAERGTCRVKDHLLWIAELRRRKVQEMLSGLLEKWPIRGPL